MELLFKIILTIHIVGGGIGLISGTINIIRKKGDLKHRKVGKAFFYGMMTAAISSLALAVMHPNQFLFITGIFTIYMVGTGMRYLSLKELASGQKPKMIDWALTVMMFLFGLAFLFIGTRALISGQTFGMVLVVFGTFGLLMVRGDYANYTGRSEIKNAWLVAHLQRMIGAYIASLTAFLVVNMELLHLPGLIGWLFPSALLVPLLIAWSRRYGVKKK